MGNQLLFLRMEEEQKREFKTLLHLVMSNKTKESKALTTHLFAAVINSLNMVSGQHVLALPLLSIATGLLVEILTLLF